MNRNKKIRRSVLVTLVLYTLVLFVASCVLFSVQTSPSEWIINSSGTIGWQWDGEAVYVILRDGSYTCMQIASTGTVIMRSTNASYVINEAINRVTSIGGGSILLKYGNYSIDRNIKMKNDTALVIEAGVTIEATYTAENIATTTGEGIIQFLGTGTNGRVVNAHIASVSGRATIKGKANSIWERGIEFRYADKCSAKGLEINNIGGDGVYLRYADENVLEDLYIHGYGKYCLRTDETLGVIVHGHTSGNKLINLHVDGENLFNDPNRGNAGSALMFNGGWGDVRNNEVIGGIYERSGFTHSIYWCSDNNGLVEGNIAIGGISRGSRGSSGYTCGFKLNPTIDSTIINWTIYNCNHGIDLGNGGQGGNVGNKIINANISDVLLGMDFWVQGGTADRNVEKNVVYANVSKADDGIRFHNDASASVPCHMMNNTIHLTTHEIKSMGIRFGDEDLGLTNEAKNNTFYVDLEAGQYGIWWDKTGYGRWNRFIGDWQSVYSESGDAVIEANYFEGLPIDGKRTHNSGTTTMNNNSSVTFDHGLIGTPDFVSVSFNCTGWGSWNWIPTATQITIYTENSVTATVYWNATYQPP